MKDSVVLIDVSGANYGGLLRDLIESGYSVKNEFDGEGVVTGLACLEAVTNTAPLETRGVWRLHHRESQRLSADSGFTPDGGWRALASLACGVGVIRATDATFERGPVSAAGWTPGETRIRLVESFTKTLIPPSASAALFLAMNMHPLWGLRVAKMMHERSGGKSSEWKDFDLLPRDTLLAAEHHVFRIVEMIISGLRSLDSSKRYPLEPFREFMRAVIDSEIERLRAKEFAGLPLLLDEGFASDEGLIFLTAELFKSVLIPAGVATCQFENEEFMVDSDILNSVSYGVKECDS